MKTQKELSGILILLFIGVLFIGIVVFAASDKGIDESHYINLNEGWHVAVNGEICDQTAMDSLVFPLVGRGDEVVLETRLPQAALDNPILVFYSVHSTVLVELDGEEIFRYGQELYEEGRLVGYGYHCIDLPEAYEGKSLRVKLLVCEDAAFSSFDTPRLYDANWYIRDYLKENRIPLIINIFLIVFGICMIGVSAVFIIRLKSLQWLKLLWVALFSIGIGCWSLCSYNLTFLLYDNLQWKVLSEFGMLYLLPVSVFAYFYKEAVGTESRLRKNIYVFIMSVQILFTVSAYVLQMTNIWHFPKMLRIQHVIMGAMALYLICMFIADIRRKRLKSMVLFVGAIVMIVFAMADLLRFNIEKYISMASGQRYVGMFCIGVMVFIAAMLLDFSSNVTSALYDAAKGKALEELAYTDALTGLANRRSCEEAFDALDADETEKRYAIGVFDLNNLKKVNDRLGHEEGDAFIRSFGEILREVFSAYGLVGRTGGDEFLVILYNISSGKIGGLIDRMNEKIELKNQEHADWSLSAAYGISEYAAEEVKTARQLYKLADERMYECKKEMHRGR